ncbi:unnamed protein product [Mycena citricolor]|uniref:Uncharacterized protein n=1 Tax=Mycena citricolor TaxID=2018698 RepID=A0AAD2HWW5_9AGAR|nr:unnamed protein product [Mycena citricolor]
MLNFQDSVEAMPMRTIRDYREHMHSKLVTQATHNPHLSMDCPERWITSHGFQLFLQFDSAVPLMDPLEPSRRDLITFREQILPPDLLSHAFFSLDNVEDWVMTGPFTTFTRLEMERSRYFPPTLSQQDPLFRPNSSMSTNTRSEAGSEVFSEDPPPLSDCSRPGSAMSIRSESSQASQLPLSASLLPDAAQSNGFNPIRPKLARMPRQPRKAQREERKGMIAISRELWVHELRTIKAIPDTWDVSRDDHRVAYLVDMSEALELLRDDKGIVQSIQAYIRKQDQDSWAGKGSGGSLKGDTDVLAFPGEPGKAVRCRCGQFGCGGMRKCEFLDPQLLENCERYEVDDTERQKLSALVLEANEHESETEWTVIARFFRYVKGLKCKAKVNGVSCSGTAVVVPYKTPIPGQNKYFIGCSAWSPQANEQQKHISDCLRPHINEDLFRYAMDHDGLLPNSPTTHNSCCFTAHPRFGLLNCAYSHMIEGQIKIGRMVPHKCPCEMLIFEPVNPAPALANKAIIFVRKPHSHPIYPRTKPSSADRQKLNAAIDAAGLGSVTTQKLLDASSTRDLYGGKRVSEESPAFADKRLVRDTIAKRRGEAYPHGMGWLGVVNRFTTIDQKKPPVERYIHSVISKNSRLVVMMHPMLAQRVHHMTAIMFDYAYKRIEGELNECDAAGFSNSLNTRILFGSVIGDGLDSASYKTMFSEFWDAVESCTGQTLKLAPFYPDAKLKVIVLDGDIAQALGLGMFLVNYNKPEISGIHTTDPAEIISYSLKMCSVHFQRHINELPKTIPLNIIALAKSILTAKTQEEIDHWNSVMSSQTVTELKNWYEHKLCNPLIFRAINQSLSKIPLGIWNTTPDSTNYVESAHATRNAETSIHLSPLRAIETAEERDNIRVRELLQIELEGVGPKRNNDIYNREKRGLQRRQWTLQKQAQRDADLNNYDNLRAEIELIGEQNQVSLDRERQIRTDIQRLQGELAIDKRRHELKQEIAQLREEAAAEAALRRNLRIQKEETDAKANALRATSLSGVRIQGCHKDSRPSNPDTAATDRSGIDCEYLNHVSRLWHSS